MIYILNDDLKKIEILKKYNFAQYIQKFRDVGTFTINAQFVDENKYLLDETKEYYVLFDESGEYIFGKITEVKQSGESSYDLLQNVYSPSNPKEQAISLALALTKQFLGGRGAYRVHGGGFAGTIQCYIPNEIFNDYKAMIETVFGEGSCVKLFVRAVGGYELKGN